MKRVAALAAGLLLAVGVAACNEEKDSDTGSGNADQGQSSPSQDEGQGDGGDEGDASDGDTMTLSGTVTEGTEKGCMLLEHKGEKYQLTGEKAKKIKADSKVEVTGTVSKGEMSTCMEGTPFTVESVSR